MRNIFFNINKCLLISKTSINIIFLILILTLFTFIPLLKVGYTTNDETHVNFIFTYDISHIFTQIYSEFKIDFYRFLENPRPNIATLLYSVPYHFFEKLYLNISYMRILSITIHIINLYLLYYLIRLIFKSTKTGFFAILIFLVSVQNSWDHNLLTSYSHHLLLISYILLSFICYYKYYELKKKKYLIASAILFFLCLSYETYAVYFPLYFIISFYYNGKEKSAIFPRIKKLLFDLKYAGIFFIIFLLFYFIMGHINKDNSLAGIEALGYEKSTENYGYTTSYGLSAIKQILNVIYQFAIASFPTYIFFHSKKFLNEYSTSFGSFQYSISYLINNIQMIWMLKALISGYLLYHLLSSLKSRIISIKLLIPGLVISLYLIFAPGIPVSLVKKYQDWVQMGTMGFINTFHSFFGVIILLIILILIVFNLLNKIKIENTKKIATVIFMTVVIIIFSMISVITDFSNNAYTLSQVQSTYKWKMVDLFIKSEEFKKIPPGSIIYAPSLFKSIGIMEIFPPYWTDYISYKTGKTKNIIDYPELIKDYVKNPRIIFTESEEEKIKVAGTHEFLLNDISQRQTKNLYYLNYIQDKKEPNQYMVFGKVNEKNDYHNGAELYADEVYVFSLSKYRRYSITGFTDEKIHGELIIDDIRKLNYDGNKFSVEIDKNNEPEVFIKTKLRAGNINLKTISLSNNADTPINNSYIYASFGNGFYQDEITHRWAKNNSTMYIVNKFNHAMRVEIQAIFATGFEKKSRLTIKARDFTDEMAISSKGGEYKKVLFLPANSAYSLQLVSDTEKVNAPKDKRALFYNIRGVTLKY